MRLVTLFFFLGTLFYSFSQGVKSSFSASSLKVCAGSSITFTNNSSGSIKVSAWGFGDGAVQNSDGKANASHQFNSPGTFEVSLAVISTNALTDASKLVIEVLPSPNANFSIEGNKCEVPANLTITNSTTQNSGNTYSWNFGNGQTSSVNNPVLSYSKSGKYTVNLTVNSPYPGCKASTSQVVDIYDFSATISGNNLFCAESGASFIAKPKMSVDSYQWDFQDGTFGENNDTTGASFKKAGNYVIELKITNNSISCVGYSYYKVTVKPLPQPSFTVNTEKVCPTFDVQFTNTFSGGTNYVWSFGDGTSYNGTNPPAHTYQSEGDMTVSLSCKGSNGCFGTTTKTKFIEVKNPTAGFFADSLKGCTLLPSTFIDTSSTPNPANPINYWSWDFGNGSTYLGQNPPKQIFDVGNYDVTLTINTVLGCKVTQVVPKYIRVGRIEKVDFSVSPVSQCAKQDIQFSDKSTLLAPHTPEEVQYTWDFGDDTKITQFNPSHSYKKDTGYFDVKLIVDFRGCLDSTLIKKSVYIKPPLSIFKPDTVLYCNPSSFPVNVKFIDLSKSGRKNDNVDVEWFFGDGGTSKITSIDVSNSSLGSTSHDYMNYGTYKVQQKVINYSTGCTDTSYQTFHISQVISDFTTDNDSVCQLSPISFLEKSYTFPSHPLSTWVFNTGDGGSVSGKNPSYAYPNAGNFPLSLTSTNSVGCFHTKTWTGMEVLALPKADIQEDKAIGCAPFNVTYSNNSSKVGNGVSMKSFYWYFDFDKSIDSSTNLSVSKIKKYPTEGKYYTTLQVVDIFKCRSFKDTSWILITKPNSSFSYKPIVCNEEEFIAVNTTVGGTNNVWIVDNNLVGSNSDTLVHKFVENSKDLSVTHALALQSVDENGCTDKVTNSIVVSLPKVKMSYSFTSQLENNINEKGEFKCPPIQCQYKDITESIGKIDSSYWNFQKSKSSSFTNPVINYLFPGVYSTKLKSVDQYGCSTDTTILNLLTILGPTAKPKWVWEGDICGRDYQFIVDSLDKVVSFQWGFDDGNKIDNELTTKHTYLNIQPYGPTITLKDSEGCSVTYPLDTIYIPDKGLNANFTVSKTEIKLGEKVQLTDFSVPMTGIVSWIWDLDDSDSIVNTTPKSVTNLYSVLGEKKLVLTVVNEDGCTDQDFKKIVVIEDYDVPNVLTPNGDGKNDFLVLFDELFVNYSIRIVNRWGNTVYFKTDQTGVNLWDGKNKEHQLCAEGVYFFYLDGEFANGHRLKKSGSVTLMY
jgi:gliding motility-associated-like protein